MNIAVAGKGGVGKSTVAALIIHDLLQRRLKPVLAVDADPNSTLAEKLGVVVDHTIGDLREDVQRDKYDAPAGTPKQRVVEYQVQQALVEGSGFDLVTMGRGEGPGCYCSINNMLRAFLQDLASSYRYVVVDNEAGMEHLSRRTNSKIDLMLIVSDPTPTSLQAAGRIARLATDLEIVKGRMGLVINRMTDAGVREDAVQATGLEVLGQVPNDASVQELELQSRSLLALPADSPAVAAVSDLLKRMGV